jgi:hypothetical protein
MFRMRWFSSASMPSVPNSPRSVGWGARVQQAQDNPKAFVALLGWIIPQQVAGEDDEPLILPDRVNRERVEAVILAVLTAEPHR